MPGISVSVGRSITIDSFDFLVKKIITVRVLTDLTNSRLTVLLAKINDIIHVDIVELQL